MMIGFGTATVLVSFSCYHLTPRLTREIEKRFSFFQLLHMQLRQGNYEITVLVSFSCYILKMKQY